MKVGLTIVLAILISATSHAQQKKVGDNFDWTLIYQNDENGNRVLGDLNKLINAVRNGEPIRIGWKIEHPTNKGIKVEHFADAQFITVLSDSVVFAQIEPIVGQTPDIKDKFVSLKENTTWAFCASSLGKNDSMNINTKTGDIIDHKQWKSGIKWFIKIH